LGVLPPGAHLLLVVLLLFAFSPRSVRASGTPAGTTITNRASITFLYDGDTLPTTVNSNVVNVIVAQVAVVNVSPVSASGSARVNTFADYPVIITNSGNGTDRFSLTTASTLGLPADLYRDIDGDGLLSASEAAAGPIGQTGDLAADSSARCVARVSVPGTVSLIGQTDMMTVTTTSLVDASKRAIAQRSTSITGAILTSSKAVSTPIPRAGDRVTYTISYGNSGNGEATNVSISDLLDSRLRFVTGAASPAPDSISGQRILWNLGPVPAGQSGALVFQVDVASNAVPGDEVHNIAAMQYNDGPNARAATSSEAGFITVQSGGPVTVDIAPSQTGTAEPGDTVQYAYVVTNTGALPESFDVSYTSTQGFLWAFYQDANGNGKTDAGEPAVTTTGVLAGGGQFRLIARAVVPLVPADLTQDIMTLNVRSTANRGNFKSVMSTTTIALPRMTLAKLATAADPRSGNEILYSITYANEGHGQTESFVLTDAIPANTAYVAGSARVNGVVKTDQADDDEVTVRGGEVTVRLGSVKPNTSGVIEFRVRIL
jgi:uncharacterized repeat protein (TIGR01451 family)